MANTFDFSCLYTTVRNISGVRKFFGYLPPNGRWLDADEEFTFFGSFDNMIYAGRNQNVCQHIRNSFEVALDNRYLEIVATPAPILEDHTGNPRIIRLNASNALTTTPPCWESSAA